MKKIFLFAFLIFIGSSLYSQVPNPPTLLSPPDSSVVTLPVLLDWNDVATATSYRIQISDNPYFTEPSIVDEVTTVSQYLFNITKLDRGTKYYWRVNATNLGGTSQWTSVWRFIVGILPPIPDPPTLISPTDSSTIPVTNFLFDWSNVSGATTYRIQISTSSNFGTLFVNIVTTASQYTHTTPSFSYNTMYYWRVNATNAGGTSQWSSVWWFFTAPAPPQPPTLLYPPNSSVNIPLTPTLDWTDVTGASSYKVSISTSPQFDTIVIPSQVTIPPGKLNYYTTYYWHVAAINNGGQSAWSSMYNFCTINSIGINQISIEIPTEYKLYNNYPNPFNPLTNIKYQITNNKFTSLKVYDVLGKEVETLVNERQSPGTYEVRFDGSNMPSGIYFYTLRSGDFTDTKRMLMIK
jgi:hypothetical protein